MSSLAALYKLPETIETRLDAHTTLERCRISPDESPKQVILRVLKTAQEKGWMDVVIEAQQALSREDKRAATTGRD